MDDNDEIKKMIETQPDFIALRRFGYSLQKLETRYPDGSCPDHVVAAALDMTEDQMRSRYASIVAELRNRLNIKED